MTTKDNAVCCHLAGLPVLGRSLPPAWRPAHWLIVLLPPGFGRGDTWKVAFSERFIWFPQRILPRMKPWMDAAIHWCIFLDEEGYFLNASCWLLKIASEQAFAGNAGKVQ